MIKLVHDYLYQSPDNHHRITTNLVNGKVSHSPWKSIDIAFLRRSGILPILDTMLIFKKLGNENQPIVVHPAHEDQWSETSLTSLNILLILLAHPNVAFCSQASIRIHSFLDYRPIHGREEAAFLLSTVNKIFSSISQTEQSERYAYILPLLTIIIDESFDLLQIRSYLPEISFHRKATTAVNDLRQAILNSKNLDWERFIEQITEPYADHYRSMSIRPFHMNMRIWWNECHERMLIGVHKRNRQIGTEKMKFQVKHRSSLFTHIERVFGLFSSFRIKLFVHGIHVLVLINKEFTISSKNDAFNEFIWLSDGDIECDIWKVNEVLGSMI